MQFDVCFGFFFFPPTQLFGLVIGFKKQKAFLLSKKVPYFQNLASFMHF